MLNKIHEQNGAETEVSFYSEINCLDFGCVSPKDFTAEALCLMIRQRIGLEDLVPLALGHLHGEPMVSGNYYAGDLLESVQRLPSEFWEQHPDLRDRWQKIQVAVSELPTF